MGKSGRDILKLCSIERQIQYGWIDKVFEYLGWTIELEETGCWMTIDHLK